MITARSPWDKAVLTDACFRRFMQNPASMQKILPVSKGVVNILTEVFAWDPRARPTLPRLKRAIEQLDTFWMTEKEISQSSNAVQQAAAYCDGKPNKTNPQPQIKHTRKLPAKCDADLRAERWIEELCQLDSSNWCNDAPVHNSPAQTPSPPRPGLYPVPSTESFSGLPSTPAQVPLVDIVANGGKVYDLGISLSAFQLDGKRS